MRKMFALWMVAVCTMNVAAQSATKEHEYIWIHQDVLAITIVPTDSSTRTIQFQKADREDSGERLRQAMRIVQQYERDGWELVDVMMQPGTAFFMRKPKQ